MLTFLRNSNIITFADIESNRSVAQFGRALRSGRRGRGFESRRFDGRVFSDLEDTLFLRFYRDFTGFPLTFYSAEAIMFKRA